MRRHNLGPLKNPSSNSCASNDPFGCGRYENSECNGAPKRASNQYFQCGAKKAALFNLRSRTKALCRRAVSPYAVGGPERIFFGKCRFQTSKVSRDYLSILPLKRSRNSPAHVVKRRAGLYRQS
jgi:hypothetical protein